MIALRRARLPFSRVLLCALALALLFLPSLSRSEAGKAGAEQIQGEWVGGLDDSGKRILALSAEAVPGGMRINLWQRTGDLHSAQLNTLSASNQSRLQLRGGEGGETFEGLASEGVIRGELSLLKWMVGFVLALAVAILVRLFLSGL